MSLERVFVICINGPFCFVLSLLAALSLLFLSSVLSLPVFLLRLSPSKNKNVKR